MRYYLMFFFILILGCKTSKKNVYPNVNPYKISKIEIEQVMSRFEDSSSINSLCNFLLKEEQNDSFLLSFVDTAYNNMNINEIIASNFLLAIGDYNYNLYFEENVIHFLESKNIDFNTFAYNSKVFYTSLIPLRGKYIDFITKFNETSLTRIPPHHFIDLKLDIKMKKKDVLFIQNELNKYIEKFSNLASKEHIILNK